MKKIFKWLRSFIPVRRSRYDALYETFIRSGVAHLQEIRKWEERFSAEIEEKVRMQGELTYLIHRDATPHEKSFLQSLLLQVAKISNGKIMYYRSKPKAYVAEMSLGPVERSNDFLCAEMHRFSFMVALDHDCPPELIARQMGDKTVAVVLEYFQKQSVLKVLAQKGPPFVKYKPGDHP